MEINTKVFKIASLFEVKNDIRIHISNLIIASNGVVFVSDGFTMLLFKTDLSPLEDDISLANDNKLNIVTMDNVKQLSKFFADDLTFNLTFDNNRIIAKNHKTLELNNLIHKSIEKETKKIVFGYKTISKFDKVIASLAKAKNVRKDCIKMVINNKEDYKVIIDYKIEDNKPYIEGKTYIKAVVMQYRE